MWRRCEGSGTATATRAVGRIESIVGSGSFGGSTRLFETSWCNLHRVRDRPMTSAAIPRLLRPRRRLHPPAARSRLGVPRRGRRVPRRLGASCKRRAAACPDRAVSGRRDRVRRLLPRDERPEFRPLHPRRDRGDPSRLGHRALRRHRPAARRDRVGGTRHRLPLQHERQPLALARGRGAVHPPAPQARLAPASLPQARRADLPGVRARGRAVPTRDHALRRPRRKRRGGTRSAGRPTASTRRATRPTRCAASSSPWATRPDR